MTKVDRSLALLDASRRRFLSELTAFDEEGAVQPPPGGGWSASQVGEHVARVEEAVTRGFRAATAGKVHAAFGMGDIPRRLVWQLQLYRFVRIEAPAAHKPEKSAKLAETISLLARNRESLLAVVQAAPLARLRLRHPVFGPLNGVEWLSFLSMHEERHRLQLVRIRKAFGRP